MPDSRLNFSHDFKAPDLSEWLSLVDKTLKGKPLDTAMQTITRDGIVIEALCTKESGQISGQPFRAAGNWSIASPNWSNNAEAVNRDILLDLERGASSVAMTISKQNSMGVLPEDLAKALDGVYLNMVPLNLIQGDDFEAGFAAFDELITQRGYAAKDISGSLGVDPIGTLARTGRLKTSADMAIVEGAAIAKKTAKRYPAVAAFNADGTVISNAGGTEAMELAGAMSAAITYLKAMEKAGLSLEVAATQIQFSFSASVDLWLTIAKFRSARRLWQNVLAACDIEPVPMKLNAVSAVHALSMKDPWVNILRGTASCFAAAIGGADTITTLPHDLFLGTTNEFSRRIARNIQIILMEESNLAKVSDPAAGSYALEKLTNDLSHRAALLFAKMEAGGGIVSVLKSGKLAADIQDAADKRNSATRKRKISITGVSEFPNIDEPPMETVPHKQEDAINTDVETGETISPLPLRRLAQDFEDLRLKGDAIYLKKGARPKIALINLGAATDFTARTSFAKNFFEAGGIETIPGEGVSTIEAAVVSFKASGAGIAVICSSDSQYLHIGIELASALKSAGCSRLYLAGKPDNLDEMFKAGVDESIYMGCDVIDALERAYDVLGYAAGQETL